MADPSPSPDPSAEFIQWWVHEAVDEVVSQIRASGPRCRPLTRRQVNWTVAEAFLTDPERATLAADLLIRKVGSVTGAGFETAASVYWQLVRLRLLASPGRRGPL